MPDLSGRTVLRHGAIALITLILATLIGGIVYQNLSLIYDRRHHAMPGQLVDVRGHRMHIDCIGQGTPTVILDSGLGDSYIGWHHVQQEIAKFVHVCSYDRAGIGYSDPTARPRTSRVFAEELHELLNAGRILPPYVLVGHSMAGYTSRLYYQLYRGDVSGMVLVDACHPDQLQRFPRDYDAMNSRWIIQGELLALSAPIGIPRLLGYCGNDVELRAAECTVRDARENASERETFRESAAQAARSGTLDHLPLMVISHDPLQGEPSLTYVERAANTAWEQMQEELSRLSTRGTRVIAKKSGHYIQDDRPEVVIEAVHRIVNESRVALTSKGAQ